MNFYTYIVMLGIILLPHLVVYGIKRYTFHEEYQFGLPSPLLVVAGIVYPIARLLPEPSLTDESVTLIQHFVGGGFISALYYFYIKKQFNLRLKFIIDIALLYAVTSSMGVANELLEFSATKLGLYQLDGSDVWWDLLANTTGAITLYAIITAWNILRKKLA